VTAYRWGTGASGRSEQKKRRVKLRQRFRMLVSRRRRKPEEVLETKKKGRLPRRGVEKNRRTPKEKAKEISHGLSVSQRREKNDSPQAREGIEKN